MIFVFGSNTRGIHGAGAAKDAYKKHGAQWSVGYGRQGNSYAIPTKDHQINTLPLGKINISVQAFILYAIAHSSEEFQVTQIGCGLAGYTPKDIAPMFLNAPSNCLLDIAWKPLMHENTRFW